MFYSQLLLSKKGALGIIWMAAHCHKRLKKDQIQQTNISSSVDKILDDEVHIVTHRILAFLLLGIVRIYSKKVEYLFHDCREVLNRLCSFKTGKRSRRESIEVPQRHYHSITLPKRFELDTFDLGLDQDATGGKVRSHEQDTRDDGRREDCSRSGSFCKVIVPISEAYSTSHTPPRDVFGAHRVDQDFVKPSSNTDISLAGVEVLRRALCSLEDCLDPMQLDESAEESGNEQLNDRPSNDNSSPKFRGTFQEEQFHDNLSHKDLRTNTLGLTNAMESDFVMGPSSSRFRTLPSLEILRGIGFALEDRLEPMVLDEAEKEQLYDRPSDKSTSSNGQGLLQDVEFNSVVNQSPKGSNPVESLGIFHESDFSLECSSSFKLLSGSEKREGHDKASDDKHGAEKEHMDHLSTPLDFQEGEDQDFTEAVDNAAPVGPEFKLLEVIALESVKCQKPDKFHVPVLNPHSKLPADVGIPEVAAVQTPGRKERAKILKKRKALMDEATVVPNKVLKSWIGEDPTDLKRRKKNTPRTLLQVWRAHKLCRLPQSFLDPLVPGVLVELAYLGCRESYAPDIKSAALSAGQAPVTHGAQEQIPGISSTITEKSPRQTPDVRSPIAEKSTRQTADVIPLEQAPAVRSLVAENSPDQIPIAPGTPVAYLNSSRFHEAATIADSDILEPSFSIESIERLEALLQEGTSSYEGESLEKGNGTYSARTRMTESYLVGKFLHKKRRKEEQVLNLSRLLAGKTKKESTIMFYEILVFLFGLVVHFTTRLL